MGTWSSKGVGYMSEGVGVWGSGSVGEWRVGKRGRGGRQWMEWGVGSRGVREWLAAKTALFLLFSIV